MSRSRIDTTGRAIRLVGDGFHLGRTWAGQEFEAYGARIRATVEPARGGYYHRFSITDAAGKRLETPETPGWSVDCAKALSGFDGHGFPEFEGKDVLDVGCNAGFYSFVAAVRGARSVVGIDQDPQVLRQAALMSEILGIDVCFACTSAYAIDDVTGFFDVVLCMGLVYHLQNPMDLLVRLARITRGELYLESEVLVDPGQTECAWFVEKTYCGDATNWWIYGPLCLERMARAAGFASVEFHLLHSPPPGTNTVEGLEFQSRGAFVCKK